MEYKRLGDYIREVNVRNKDLKVTNPMGINIEKYFMPSVANVIGTDLSAYKMVGDMQFACNLMHVGRDEKIPMAMHKGEQPLIVSPAYFVFENSKPNELLSDYLMMWFRRPEFDRSAWFYTDADVRGGMTKDALLDMTLLVPSIDRQREIVEEYETLSRRIRQNEQMIEKLEATAKALYCKMFVDDIDKENLPEGWRMGTLEDVVIIRYGKAHEGIADGDIPIYGSGGIMRYGNKALFDMPSVLIPRKGSLNNIMYVDIPFWTVDTMFYTQMRIKNVSKYLYIYLCQFDFLSMDAGSAVPSMTSQMLNQMEILIPDEKTLGLFEEQESIIFRNINLHKQEISKLSELQSLLLVKMGSLKQ